MINFDKQKVEAKVRTAYNKIKNLKRRTKELICVGMTVLMLGSFVICDANSSAAYASSGTSTTPYAIMAGDEELAVVKSRADAEMVVSNIKEAYGKDSSTTAMITPAISIQEKEYVTAEAVDIQTTSEATDTILEENKGSDPIFKVVVEQPVVTTQSIPQETKVIETDDLMVGEEKVGSEGKAGSKIVLGKQTLVNGEVKSSTVYSEEVTAEPEDKIVYKGTKEEEPEVVTTTSTSSSSTSSSSSSSSSSSKSSSSSTKVAYNSSKATSIVGYAQSFTGIPYVYGGSSPSEGFDCSGFTQYVYKAFGVNLPRSSSAQASVGIEVSASEAKPGDLVVMPGHVGIYAGNGYIVHSPRPGKSVCTVKIWQSCTYRRIVQ